MIRVADQAAPGPRFDRVFLPNIPAIKEDDLKDDQKACNLTELIIILTVLLRC
jgi:hypothetical protein